MNIFKKLLKIVVDAVEKNLDESMNYTEEMKSKEWS